MAPLQDRLKTSLDECRMVILGAQVLLGVEYNAVFEPAFSRLPSVERATMGAGIYLVSAALALLFVPATYHLIVEDGRDTKALHELTTRVIEIALVPLAPGLGCLCLLAAARVASPGLAVITGLAATLAALFFWYAFAWERRRAKQRRQLPALAVKDDDAGLLIIALATILLLAPAACRRIVEHGENTESFHRVAGRFLLSAIACLGLGMAAESAVIAWMVTHSGAATAGAGLGILAVSYTMWFGYAVYRRRQRAFHQVRGFKSSSMVGSSSETVGWMCMARCNTV